MLAESSSPQMTAKRPLGWSRAVWLELLFVGLLFGVALALRVYNLQAIPPGLYTDEAANGLDVLDVLAGRHSIFFPRNSGREPLFLYLQAGMVALLGATPYALRLTAALVGALAVPAAYWAVREAFTNTSLNARWMATWSTLFIAFGYWHISLSRLGFRANLLPLMAALTFALFWRAWRPLLAGQRFPWLPLLLTGAALGATLYTYTASRFMPVLVVLMACASMLVSGQSSQQRLRILGALCVIGITSAAVFAPLGWYFWQNPDMFFARAASVSVMSEQYSGGEPLLALAKAVGKTALMFLTLGDPNLRHNPASRPVFDIVLGIWLGAGLLISLIRWRRLPYLFFALWALLLALPAALTAEALPHSLRASGMIPAVYVLPVIAMMETGAWLARRNAIWRNWLPLPFLLFSAVTGVHDYFSAWSPISRFHSAFMPGYVQLAQDFAKFGDEDGIWLLTLSPAYFVDDTAIFTIDFMYRGESDYANLLAEPDMAPQRMRENLNGHKFAYLVHTQQNTTRFPDASYVLGDPKHLAAFLLDKYAVRVAEYEDSLLGLPFDVYQLPEQAEYEVYHTLTPRDDLFDSKVRLIGAAYGRTARARTDVDVNSTQVPAGEPIWLALQWRAESPIDIDLKASLILRDAAGHIAGQVDDLLVVDRYPVERTWEAGETTGTYHILPTLPALAPGNYELSLRVYEDQTLQTYPVVDSQGNVLDVDVNLGQIEVVPSSAVQEVAPQQRLADPPQLAEDLALLGYDLPSRSVAPGGVLPLTFYWHALDNLKADYRVNLQLRSSDLTPIVDRVQPPAGGAYPTSLWSRGATIRDWQDLAIPPTTPAGAYNLLLSVMSGVQSMGQYDLGEIVVEGRPHIFTPPDIGAPIVATFDQEVRLLGLEKSLAAVMDPGAQLSVPLIWQVLQPSLRPLVRFVHLIDSEGRLVAQQDTIPCNGECPATSWLAGEVLQDEAILDLPPSLVEGQYTLVAGWYDSNTLQRLMALDDRGTPLPDQRVELPFSVEIAR